MLSFWNLQKATIFFRNAKPTVAESLEIPWHVFYKTAIVREKRRRQAKMKGTSYTS